MGLMCSFFQGCLSDNWEMTEPVPLISSAHLTALFSSHEKDVIRADLSIQQLRLEHNKIEGRMDLHMYYSSKL